MSDPVNPAAAKKPRTPANQNPWYVLMTLFGEQDGEEIDWDLHEKNRVAWDLWSNPASGDTSAHISWMTNSENIISLHEKEWRRRNPQSVSYPGIPDSNNPIDCSRVDFDKKLILAGYKFYRNASFGWSAFKESVWLSDSTFFNYANFILSIFMEEARFDDATFKNRLSFDSATFYEDTGFRKLACEGSATFRAASFWGDVVFDNAKFNSYVGFREACILGDFSCSMVRFGGHTNFSGASFGKPGSSQRVNFIDCIFLSATNFRSTKFSVQYPEFYGAVLHNETTFTPDEPDSKNSFWPKSPSNPKAAKESCAKIRNNLAKQGFPEDEHFFYRKEMRFAGMAATNPVEKLAYWLFGALSDYGYSFVRPAVAIASVFVLGLMAYWGYFLQGTIDTPLGTALGLSLSNLFPYFGFARFFESDFVVGLPPVLKALGGFQTVSGAILLFLFALGLRTRFRMR